MKTDESLPTGAIRQEASDVIERLRFSVPLLYKGVKGRKEDVLTGQLMQSIVRDMLSAAQNQIEAVILPEGQVMVKYMCSTDGCEWATCPHRNAIWEHAWALANVTIGYYPWYEENKGRKYCAHCASPCDDGHKVLKGFGTDRMVCYRPGDTGTDCYTWVTVFHRPLGEMIPFHLKIEEK